MTGPKSPVLKCMMPHLSEERIPCKWLFNVSRNEMLSATPAAVLGILGIPRPGIPKHLYLLPTVDLDRGVRTASLPLS